MLHDYLRLTGEQAAINAEIKAHKNALDRLVFVKYSELTSGEIKRLVIDDKWMRQLDSAVTEEIRRLSQNLTARVKTLAARYAASLPELHGAVETLTAKVNGHLAKMGFAV